MEYNALKQFTKAELMDMVAERVRQCIRVPADVKAAVLPFAMAKKEYFLVITLDGSNTIINTHTVSIGIANRALVHPREVFRPAILDAACAVIVAHNHPSGNMEPSEQDDEVTRRLIQAGELLGIPCFDHIIFHGVDFISYRDKNRIFR